MDLAATLLKIATVTGVIVGIIAGVISVIDFFLKRRKEKAEEKAKKLAVAIPSSSKPAVLHNLPARGEFIGRVTEKKKVHDALKSRSYIVSIDGIGGVGKTSLALEVANECLKASQSGGDSPYARFEGFVWVSCKNTKLSLDLLLSQIARVLDYPSILQNDPDQKKLAVLRLLSEKPYLIILDNFESVDDPTVIEYVENLPEPSKILVTTREQTLKPAWAISLKGLAEEEGFTLIRSEGNRLNLKPIEAADTATLRHLYQATGGIPLAVKWAVGQIKQKGQSIEGLLQMLYHAKGDIFEDIFAHSWDIITQQSKNLIFTLSVFPTTLTKDELEAGANIHHFDLDDALGLLVEMSLVEATDDLDDSQRRYSIHQLTRFIARSKLSVELPDFESMIMSRMTGYYFSYTKELAAKGWEGYQEIIKEKENLFYLINWGYANEWAKAKEIALSLKWFLWEYGYWQEIVQTYNQGYYQAEENGDPAAMGRFAKEIAWVYYRQGKTEEALVWTERAKQAWSQAQADILDLADFDSLTALIEKAKGNLENSKQLLEKALDDFKCCGESRVETLRIMTYLGELERDKGNTPAAKAWFQKTLEEAEAIHQKAAVAWSYGNLGEIEFNAQNYADAKELLTKGLDAGLQISRLHTIANCAFELGIIASVEGEQPAALNYYQLALDKYNRLGIENKIAATRAAIDHLQTAAR